MFLAGRVFYDLAFTCIYSGSKEILKDVVMYLEQKWQ
jgi:hypothetical protein